MRPAVSQRSPVEDTVPPSPIRRARSRPSKTADGQILFQISDAVGTLSSPGKRKKWALHNASLTKSSLTLERSDGVSKLTIQLRDMSGRMEYKLKVFAQTWMPGESGANPLQIFPFALVGIVDNGIGSRLAAVSEAERYMWISAFKEVAGVQVE